MPSPEILGGRRPRLPLEMLKKPPKWYIILLMVVRRRLKIESPGLAFITTTVKDWIPLFLNVEAAKIVLKQFEETVDFHEASIVGYVLMPSHLHAIIGLRNILDLTNVMHDFKSLSSRKLEHLKLMEFGDKFQCKGSFQLWRPRFDDFVIRTPEQFRIKLNYIHENPVRAGLVTIASEWKYSSAGDWTLGIEGVITINKNSVGVEWTF